MEMSKEFQRFWEDMKADRELYRKLEEIGRRMMKAGSKESGNVLMAKAAAELGYSITAAELDRAEAAAEEVDDNQLEGVSGGDDLPSTNPANCKLTLSCNHNVDIIDPNGDNNICHRYPYRD